MAPDLRSTGDIALNAVKQPRSKERNRQQSKKPLAADRPTGVPAPIAPLVNPTSSTGHELP
jgi:hypothetical protein